jgi:hypothetical protein
MSFLSRLLHRSCAHYFSWPRTDAEGRYYQICSRCGTAYEYDWASMRRTDRLVGQNAGKAQSSAAVARPDLVIRLPLGR